MALESEDLGDRANAARTLAAYGESVLPNLLGALESAGPTSRTRMAEALVSNGTSSASLLITLLPRASPALQISIARAIAKTESGTLDTLLPLLHHEQPATRRSAIVALHGAGKAAIPHLAEALRDRDRSVRREAASALAALRWAPDNLSEKVWFYFLQEDWTELAKLQGAAVPTLLKALSSKEPRIQCESARTLGAIRDARAIPALIETMKDPQPDVRARAAEALGEIGDDRAKPPLVGALNDPYHQVRMEAAWGLDRLDWIPQSDLQKANYLIAREQWSELVRMGTVAILPLIQALEVEYSGVRTGASEALRQLGQPAFNALNATTRSGSPTLREQARIALEYIQSRQEESSRTRAMQKDSSGYDRELKEGLAAQKRIVTSFGPTTRAHGRPSRRLPPPTQMEEEQPPTEGEASIPEPTPQPPDDVEDLELLLEGSRRGEEAWTETKSQIKPQKPVSLDEILPASDDEQTTADAVENEHEEVPAPQNPGIVVLPEPDLPVAPLEQAQEKASLERYLKALESPDEEIRATAIAALRSLGRPAIEYLIQALADPHNEVRIAAVEGLGEIGDEDGVDVLILLTGDTDRDIRIATATALGQIGDARAIDPLVCLFSDRYPGVRSAAAAAVAAFGSDALEPLEGALTDPTPAVRVTAVRAIGAVGNPGSIPLLTRYLEDPAPEVRVVVARALGEFGHPAVEPLSRVLREGEKEGRLAAIDALVQIGSGTADTALRYALRDKDPDVREKAVAAFRKRRTPGNPAGQGEEASAEASAIGQAEQRDVKKASRQEIGALIAALKDDSVEVQLAAATRLISMGRPAAEGLILALKAESPEMRIAAAGVLGEMRETAVEPLVDALSDPERVVRIVAARNLGNIGNKRAIEALIGSLHQEPDGEVRATVAEALGYMGSKQAIESLVLALRDRDDAVQIAAARSLGYIGDKRAVEPLIQALSDVDDRVRHAALEALKDPGGTARGHLVGALRSGDERRRAGVAEALEALGWEPENSEEETLYLMARDRWVEVDRVGADALPVLAGALSDPSIEVRANAVRGIARIGGDEAVAPLIEALQDDALVVRKRAERALVDMGEAVLPALSRAAAQPGAREEVQRVIDEIRRDEPGMP